MFEEIQNAQQFEIIGALIFTNHKQTIQRHTFDTVQSTVPVGRTVVLYCIELKEELKNKGIDQSIAQSSSVNNSIVVDYVQYWARRF